MKMKKDVEIGIVVGYFASLLPKIKYEYVNDLTGPVDMATYLVEGKLIIDKTLMGKVIKLATDDNKRVAVVMMEVINKICERNRDDIDLMEILKTAVLPLKEYSSKRNDPVLLMSAMITSSMLGDKEATVWLSKEMNAQGEEIFVKFLRLKRIDALKKINGGWR
jgi:hypothetical protein